CEGWPGSDAASAGRPVASRGSGSWPPSRSTDSTFSHFRFRRPASRTAAAAPSRAATIPTPAQEMVGAFDEPTPPGNPLEEEGGLEPEDDWAETEIEELA